VVSLLIPAKMVYPDDEGKLRVQKGPLRRKSPPSCRQKLVALSRQVDCQSVVRREIFVERTGQTVVRSSDEDLTRQTRLRGFRILRGVFCNPAASAEEFAWLAGNMVRVRDHRIDLWPLPGPGSEPLLGYLARPNGAKPLRCSRRTARLQRLWSVGCRLSGRTEIIWQRGSRARQPG